MDQLFQKAADEAGVDVEQAQSVAELLDAGATIPFIARYRKEATGGLDEVQIGALRDGLKRGRDLEERRAAILESIDKQGKLTAALRKRIRACESCVELEDLYVPYRPKRRTRATVARQQGLEPLADQLWEQGAETGTAEDLAKAFVNKKKKVRSPEEALAGACDILAERIVALPEVRQEIRTLFREQSAVCAKRPKGKGKGNGKGKGKGKGKKDSDNKFKDYYEFNEPLSEVASHRLLALFRGEKEQALSVSFAVDADKAHRSIHRQVIRNPQSVSRPLFEKAAVDAYDRMLSKQIETETRQELKERADLEALDTFANNLRNLLLAAPLPAAAVLAIDPGFRTGCKFAVLDSTGRLLEHGTVYPTEPRNDVAGTHGAFDKLLERHPIAAFAVGNGTGGRETDTVVRDYLQKRGRQDIPVVMVNESGASIYSASPAAREEFPDLDLTVRGAISIGRRLQDPLAELVKLDPGSLGVGEYQHDVDQQLLQEKLDEVVTSCVNHVGVDLNTASAALLGRVSGIGPKLAKAIVSYREKNGPFSSRRELLDVPGLGAKTFEQAAGFLRVRGSNPLDNSAIHPERYEFVEKLSRDLGVSLEKLVGNQSLVTRIDADRYRGDDVGTYTLNDILDEIRKPGRDPRADFTPVHFRDDVREPEDLREGMILEGAVTNVTPFGAFVDVGVHRDGLVHISQLADRFVEDPHEIVKVGDRVRVRVLDIDHDRERIALSMKDLRDAPLPVK
jgi:uncharacterized protein